MANAQNATTENAAKKSGNVRNGTAKKTGRRPSKRERNETANIEADAIKGRALEWAKSCGNLHDRSISLDAQFVMLAVQAHEAGIMKLDRWHTLATPDAKKRFYADMLAKLFPGMAKFESAQRQRIERAKIAVPAILKAGGSKAVELSNSGKLLLDTTTELWKKAGTKTDSKGKLEISVSKLNSTGAKSYLGIRKSGGTGNAGQGKTVSAEEAFAKVPLPQIAKMFEDRVAKFDPAEAKAAEKAALEKVLVQLVGIFAIREDHVDVDAINSLYSKDAAKS